MTWACILTWLFASPAALLFAATFALVAADPDTLIDEMRTQNPDLADQLADAADQAPLYVVCGGIVVWSLVAVVLAVLVWRRVPWAAVALMVSAGAAARLLPVHRAGVVRARGADGRVRGRAGMLLRPESRAWFAAQEPLRSAAASRATPSAITSRVLQNAKRTRCRPPSGSVWSS